MFNFDIDDDELEELDSDDSEFNLEDFKKNISSFTPQKLCQIVVCYRYLNFNPDLATLCMEELGERRVHGLVFDFEEHIEKSLKELPSLNFSMPDLGAIMSQIKK
jgi:hypothetical protein